MGSERGGSYPNLDALFPPICGEVQPGTAFTMGVQCSLDPDHVGLHSWEATEPHLLEILPRKWKIYRRADGGWNVYPRTKDSYESDKWADPIRCDTVEEVRAVLEEREP